MFQIKITFRNFTQLIWTTWTLKKAVKLNHRPTHSEILYNKMCMNLNFYDINRPRTVGEFCYIVNLLVTATSSDLNLLVQLFLLGCTFFLWFHAKHAILREQTVLEMKLSLPVSSVLSQMIFYMPIVLVFFFYQGFLQWWQPATELVDRLNLLTHFNAIWLA